MVDSGMNKRYLFFIPNDLTPSQMYYTSQNNSTSSGFGGIQISGSYSYISTVNLVRSSGLTGSTTYSGYNGSGFSNTQYGSGY